MKRREESIMEIKDMKLTEIQERKKELDSFDVDNATFEEIEANTLELRNLNDREQAILNAAEERKAQIKTVVDLPKSEVIKTFKEERKMEFNAENVRSTKEYRSAWAKSLMGLNLNEAEKRAVGVALTTTADTYVASAVGADGVNNGGLFIPDDVMMELMNRMELVSPFFRDVPKTAVNGYVKFPYRKDGTGALEQAEGTANTDGQVEWAELTLTVLEVSETIRVTWKLEAMAVDSFIDYIIDELAMAIPEKIANDMFYGDGTGTISGISKAGNFLDGEYTIGEADGNVSDIFAAIEAGIKLLTNPRKRMGAKIYVAQDVMDSMIFARGTDDSFLYNPINGIGIKSLSKYDIEVDPFLNDGDFVIGNPRYFKFNWNEALSITKDVSGKNRINDYTGYAVVSGAPQPSSFVYGKKSA